MLSVPGINSCICIVVLRKIQAIFKKKKKKLTKHMSEWSVIPLSGMVKAGFFPLKIVSLFTIALLGHHVLRKVALPLVLQVILLKCEKCVSVSIFCEILLYQIV